MKAYLTFTNTESILILTSYDSPMHPELLKKLENRGIVKFLAYEVSIESARAKYGMYFDFARNDLRETDDLKVLSYSDKSAAERFSFNELGKPIFYKPEHDYSLACAEV